MEKTDHQLLFAETLQRLTSDLVRYSSLLDRVCTENLTITGPQGYTLLAIPDNESISMNDLSLKMKLAGSTMTRMVDQLVQKAWPIANPILKTGASYSSSSRKAAARRNTSSMRRCKRSF